MSCLLRLNKPTEALAEFNNLVANQERVYGGESLAVADQHPDVGQEVVREVDGLRALQVRVAGHRPVGVQLGALVKFGWIFTAQLAQAYLRKKRR